MHNSLKKRKKQGAFGVFLQTLRSNAKKVFLRIANAKIQCEESVPSSTPRCTSHLGVYAAKIARLRIHPKENSITRKAEICDAAERAELCCFHGEQADLLAI